MSNGKDYSVYLWITEVTNRSFCLRNLEISEIVCIFTAVNPY